MHISFDINMPSIPTLRSAFNGAVAFAGGIVLSGAALATMIEPSLSSVFVAAGGSALFALGYSRFFFSGKTTDFIKKSLGDTGQPETDTEEKPKSLLKIAFNAAVALGATAGIIFDQTYMLLSTVNFLGGSARDLTSPEIAAHSLIVAGLAGLFALGYSEFFFSGKTTDFLRKVFKVNTEVNTKAAPTPSPKP